MVKVLLVIIVHELVGSQSFICPAGSNDLTIEGNPFGGGDLWIQVLIFHNDSAQYNLRNHQEWYQIYMVTTVLKLSEISNPIILASGPGREQHQPVFKIHSLDSHDGISDNTKVNAWMAEIINCTATFDRRYPDQLRFRNASRFRIFLSLMISSALTVSPMNMATITDINIYTGSCCSRYSVYPNVLETSKSKYVL